jgi:glucose-6-phosphate dehydrogenase assembly protein OpcA
MATTTYKTLGQAAPAATTSTDLYIVPAATSAIVSTITIANRAATDATFRISQSLTGAALANKDYLVYDATVPASGFITLTLGITMATTDKLRVYASSGDISFNAFGTELS